MAREEACTIALPANSPRVKVRTGARLAALEVGRQRGWRIRAPEALPLATPALAYGNLYFGGGYGSHVFYAVNAATGKTVWKLHTHDDGPTAALCYQGDVLFNTESCTIYCVDARSGRVRWKRWLGDPLMNQPAAWEGKVYMAYPDSKGQHRLLCMDARNGKSLWSRPIDGDLISAPVLDEGVAYLATMSGQVCAFDARAGKPLWSRQYHATSAPWVHAGQVFVSLREAGAGGRAAEASPAESVATLGVVAGAVQQRQARRAGARYLTRAYNDGQAKAKLFNTFDAQVGFAAAPPAAHLAAERRESRHRHRRRGLGLPGIPPLPLPETALYLPG
jgi:outer membrane protein assembly factor BamB